MITIKREYNLYDKEENFIRVASYEWIILLNSFVVAKIVFCINKKKTDRKYGWKGS